MSKIIKIWIAEFISNLVQFCEINKGRSFFIKLLSEIIYIVLESFGFKVCNIYNNAKYSSKGFNLVKIPLEIDRNGVTSKVVFNESKNTGNPLLKYPLPDLNLFCYENVCIHGNSNFVIDKYNNCVISDSSYDLDERLRIYDGLLYRQRGNVAILRNNLKKISKHLDSGIIISGKFSSNYYHEVYENLIRLLVVPKLNIPIDVPVIIDIVVNNIESFKCILDTLRENIKRNIIFIGNHELISFNKMYTISPINNITSHIKKIELFKLSDYVYDPFYMSVLRNSLLKKKSANCFSKNIFISRSNISRRNFNEDEVLNCLTPYGFVAVYPETLTFGEQISLFNNAEWIIGGSGAAFSNLIFCQNQCNVLCIVESTKLGIPVFSTIGYLSGCKIYYYGEKEDEKSDDVHADFIVDVDKFYRTFKMIYDESN